MYFLKKIPKQFSFFKKKGIFFILKHTITITIKKTNNYTMLKAYEDIQRYKM